MLRVARHIRLQAVLEVGDEAQFILKLHEDSLIVVSLPPATYLSIVTFLSVAILAKAALSGVIGPNLDLPDVFVGKAKGLIVSEHLHAVRNIVRAQFTLLKQVEDLAVLSHVEVPNGLLKLLSEAVDGLVGAGIVQQRQR